MNDAEYEAQKRRVRMYLDKWVKPLGLGWWQVTVEYERDATKTRDKEHRSGEWESTFECNADWRYADAQIIAYLRAILTLSDKELEQAVVHELCHIFLNETRQNGDDWLDHEERVATMLSKAFLWLKDSVQQGGQDTCQPVTTI